MPGTARNLAVGRPIRCTVVHAVDRGVLLVPRLLHGVSEPQLTYAMDRRVRRDRRRVPRGGRREYDRPGRYPPVLIADSYAPARRPCALYLERHNFDVHEAADGEEALARIVASPPRIVLIEWGLPGMSGERLSHWLAQGWRTRDVRVIAMAGAGGDEGLPAMAQVDAVLFKPFSLSAMLEEIRRVLRDDAGDEPPMRS